MGKWVSGWVFPTRSYQVLPTSSSNCHQDSQSAFYTSAGLNHLFSHVDFNTGTLGVATRGKICPQRVWYDCGGGRLNSGVAGHPLPLPFEPHPLTPVSYPKQLLWKELFPVAASSFSREFPPHFSLNSVFANNVRMYFKRFSTQDRVATLARS